MPGFSGQGSRDFEFAAGSVHGYRWWCLDVPELRRNPLTADDNWDSPGSKVLRGQHGGSWSAGENTARCAYFPDEHTLIEESCGCGFWAYWAPPEIPHFRSNQLWLLGVVQGYGRTFTGTEGFRCQKARIVALHLASQFEVVTPYGDPWFYDWRAAFTQPGMHHPPAGRPVMSGLSASRVSDEELSEAMDRMRSWQAVIEGRLERLYPGARIMAERRALLSLYPPFADRSPV
jgi:hypothetical protein